MAKKTILIASDNLPNQVNGVVTTFTQMIRAAKSLEADYEFFHVNPSLFKHFGLFKYPEVKISVPLGINKIIEEINPDYVHIATEGPIGIATKTWCDRKGVRYNTSYHTNFPKFLKCIYRVPEFLTYSYLRWFHKHSGVVLTTTVDMANDLVSKGFINVIPWTRGVDRNELKPTITKRSGRQNPIILSVGRISKEKGLDDLASLQDKYEVVVVGDGPYRKELEKKIPKATFVGYKQKAELANYYYDADVFVFTSRTDTFGLVMIEAMSLGTPVAAYPVRGPLEVINEDTGVMHCDIRVAVEKALLMNRDRVRRASNKWSWEECWSIFERNLVR